MANGEETQFSTYKIDYHEIARHHTITWNEESPTYARDIRDFLLREMKKSIEKRHQSEVVLIEKGNFKGFIYKTSHFPEWRDMAISLLSDCAIDDMQYETWLKNINVSYVLLCVHEKNLYAMTGGFGNHVVKNYIEKNWGLYLIPKLVQSDSGIIRQLKENNMFGNASAISKANRKTTNISLEQDMSTIFRELSVEVGREIGSRLGIKYDEQDSINKKTGVILKDSIVIRKNLTLDELEKVIEQIEKIEKEEEDKFPLGYFLPVRKKGIKINELLNELADSLLEGNLDNFQLVGDDYLNYYMIASEYILTKESGEPYYVSAEPINLEQIFDAFVENEKKLSRSFILSFLKKWKISAEDSNGVEILHPISIIDAIQGFVEHGERHIPCYIFQGQWYCMDGQYTPILQKEFSGIYEDTVAEVAQIKDKFGLGKCGMTEDKYNNDFFKNRNIIVGHKALISNFEIADLIFWDSNYVYLMCNKYHYDGSGSRDLTNQIWASAIYFQNQMQSPQRTDFLENWYLKIKNLYIRKNFVMPISNQAFCNLFEGRSICYIAGYLTGFDKNAESLYAKYLTVDLFKKMQNRGFKYLSMSIE